MDVDLFTMLTLFTFGREKEAFGVLSKTYNKSLPDRNPLYSCGQYARAFYTKFVMPIGLHY